MNLVTRPFRTLPLTCFFVLACFFGWIFFIGRALGFDLPAEQLPLGPIIAAAIVTAAVGRPELQTWGRALAKVRASVGWYAVAILLPIAIVSGAVVVNTALGAPVPTAEQLPGAPDLLVEMLVILVFIGIGEEAGWTAYLAPRLLERHVFLKAWLVLSVVRVLWHLPLMLTGDLPLVLGIFGNMAFQMLLLWTFVGSGRVWFLAAIWHTVLNTVGGSFFFTMVDGPDRARLGLLVTAGYVIVALVVLFVDRQRPQTEAHADLEARSSVQPSRARPVSSHV